MFLKIMYLYTKIHNSNFGFEKMFCWSFTFIVW